MIVEPSNAPAHKPTPTERARRRGEHRALVVLAIIAIAVIAWVSRPVGVGMFIGALTAFILQPLYARLLERVHRAWLAQMICLLLTALLVTVIVLGISAILIARGSIMGVELMGSLQPGGQLRAYIQAVNAKVSPFGFDIAKVVDHLRDAASSVAEYVASVATTVAGKTFHAVLTLFFVLLTTHLVLARGVELEQFIEDSSPLSRPHTRSLIDEIRHVGKATLLGSVVTGLAQGLLAGIIFAVVKLPEPVFFGVAAAVASLFPGVGTMLVWVPAGAYLIATGHVGRGVIELMLSSVFVVAFCDYVLRPRLVGGESMPALLTFAALFGGVEAFGLVGLLVGPLLMSVAVAVLRLYRDDVLAEPNYDVVADDPPA